MTTSKGLNSLSCQQSKPTTHTKKKCDQSFDCLVTHPDANISFYALDVMPCIYSDASHMNEPGAKSTAGGHCFMSSARKNGQATKLNGAICSSCTALKLVAASTSEAELGALFLNAQEARIMRLTVKEMAIHNRPPQCTLTMLRQQGQQTDNAAATGAMRDTPRSEERRVSRIQYA